ncbi:glycosyltransferase family 2 protein [Nitrospira sp. Kam-Ns4a]
MKSMDTGHLVSIIVPAFNAERFIQRALGSALAQSYSHMEVIVVDDGSTDCTAELVKGFDDPRIRYCYQRNAGQGAARNRGLAQARGQYITFLDADDQYLPGKIEKQVGFLEAHPDYVVCYCNALHFYTGEPERVFRKPRGGRSGNLLSELLKTSFINPNTVMVRREVLDKVGGFNETRYYPEDWDLWLRIALAGYQFGYLDEDLVVVEIRPDSNTTMDIQATLKANAIAMFERLFPHPISVDGRVYSAERTIRSLKCKLAIAHLLTGRRREFLHTFLAVFPSKAAGYVVGGLLASLPRSLWPMLWKMNQLRQGRPVVRR